MQNERQKSIANILRNSIINQITIQFNENFQNQILHTSAHNLKLIEQYNLSIFSNIYVQTIFVNMSPGDRSIFRTKDFDMLMNMVKFTEIR